MFNVIANRYFALPLYIKKRAVIEKVRHSHEEPITNVFVF